MWHQLNFQQLSTPTQIFFSYISCTDLCSETINGKYQPFQKNVYDFELRLNILHYASGSSVRNARATNTLADLKRGCHHLGIINFIYNLQQHAKDQNELHCLNFPLLEFQFTLKSKRQWQLLKNGMEIFFYIVVLLRCVIFKLCFLDGTASSEIIACCKPTARVSIIYSVRYSSQVWRLSQVMLVSAKSLRCNLADQHSLKV